MRKQFHTFNTLGTKGNIVIALSCVILLAITLTGLSVRSYIIYRLRLNAKTKQSYEMMTVMEQASKIAGSSWAKNEISGGGFALPPPPVSCSQACLAKTGSVPQMCFDNKDHPGKPYCFYGGNLVASNMKLELRGSFEDLEPFTAVDRVFAKIDEVFLKRRNYLNEYINLDVFGSEAIASAYENYPNNIVGGNPVNCNPGVVSANCMTCGPGTDRACLTIYACPGIFKNCDTYAGGTVGALFIQNFYLIPPGKNE